VALQPVGLLLGVIIQYDIVAKTPFSLAWVFHPGENATQGGFPSAVDADERDPIASLKNEIEVAEHLEITVPFADMLQFEHDTAAARCRGKMKANAVRDALRRFEQLHPFKLLDAALNLRGF